MEYRKYPLSVKVNGIRYDEVWIDRHYEAKHSETITDKLILLLVERLEAEDYEPDLEREDGFSFHVSDLWLDHKPYRVVWVTPPDGSYLGVRTAFRTSQRRSK